MINGKSIMSWNVPAICDGDPEEFTELLELLNFEAVCLKVADGNTIQHVSEWSPWPEWGQNVRPELVQTLKAAGIKVYFWHFLYGYDPVGEADVAVRQCSRFQPDGYIWNVEGSFDNRPNAEQNARLITSELLRTHPSISQGLCWWALPKSSTGTEWHPVSVAEAFFESVDVGMPMMYWQGKGADAATNYLHRSLGLWRGMTDLPIVPIGRAYNGDGGYADGPGITAFAEEVYSLLQNLVGNSWYSFDKAVQNLSWTDALQETPKFNVVEEPTNPDPKVPGVCPNTQIIKVHTALLADLNNRVIALEFQSPGEPDPDPDPVPEPEPDPLPEPEEWPYVATIDLRDHNKDYTIAWAITSVNNDVLIIETNVWVVTNDEKYKFYEGQEINVFPAKVTSDGGQKWFELADVPMGCPFSRLFIKKEHAMKTW